jgi:DNA-binding response OmpR family regulator
MTDPADSPSKPAVLAVDDDPRIRKLIKLYLTKNGFAVEFAENGVEALGRVKATKPDLIILDVNMPVMDGPTMLAALRETGNQTPVILLTSEVKRSIVAGAVKLGLTEYVMKPFKSEELVAKARAAVTRPGAWAPPTPHAPAGPGEGSQSVDVMVVDDMENVAKRLRALLPANITLADYPGADAALAACREKLFRVVLVDAQLPDVNPSALASQIKMLQPRAVIVAMIVKSPTSQAAAQKLKTQGFQDVMLKPFSSEAIEDFLGRYFVKPELVTRDDNLIKVQVGPYVGRPDVYFSQLGALFPAALEQVASACFEDAIVDLSGVVIDPRQVVKLTTTLLRKAGDAGLKLRIVGTAELKRLLSGFEETRRIPIFPSVTEARTQP